MGSADNFKICGLCTKSVDYSFEYMIPSKLCQDCYYSVEDARRFKKSSFKAIQKIQLSKVSSSVVLGSKIGSLSERSRKPLAITYIDDSVDENCGYKSKWYTRDELNAFLKDVRFGDCLEVHGKYFNHWAIYVGNEFGKKNMVVHIGGTSGWGFSSSSSSSGSSDQACMDQILSMIGTSKYRINNQEDIDNPPSNRRVIFQKISNSLESLSSSYHVLSNNCEHFALFIRNNVQKSEQASKVKRYTLEACKFIINCTPIVRLFTSTRAAIAHFFN